MAKENNYIISKKQIGTVDFILCSTGFQEEKKRYMVGIMRHKNTEKFPAFSQFKSSFSSPLQTDESIFLPLKTFFGVLFCLLNNHQ